MNNRPTTVVILGITYNITYTDKPSEVDIYKRESLWGQIDYWTRTIRVYDNGRSVEDIWDTLLHEIIHGLAQELHLYALKDEDNHDELDVLALGLRDVLFRNGWLAVEDMRPAEEQDE